MTFILICVGSLVVLGVVAALASMFTKGGTDEPVVQAHDCSSCSSVASGECKIGCLLEEKRLMEEKKRQEAGKSGLRCPPPGAINHSFLSPLIQ